MVAVVNEDEATVLHIPLEMIAFDGRKLNQLMTAQVAERTAKQIVAVELYHAFFFLDRNGRVLNQRVQYVGGHPLVGIPVAGGILDAREDEGFH